MRGCGKMSYNGRPNDYLNNIANNLRNVRHVLGVLYGSSVYRARREGTSLSVALIRNLGDVYDNGLEALCIPLPQAVGDMPPGAQYVPPLVYARNKGNKNHQRKKLKRRKGGRGWFDMKSGQTK